MKSGSLKAEVERVITALTAKKVRRKSGATGRYVKASTGKGTPRTAVTEQALRQDVAKLYIEMTQITGDPVPENVRKIAAGNE